MKCSGHKPEDHGMIASTDYSMHQAEEFTLLPCPHCQQAGQDTASSIAMLEKSPDGVDAEMALLRNILIYGGNGKTPATRATCASSTARDTLPEAISR
ncbi:cell surface hyaluronidase-like protein [Lates japonicus]|uniref:Cell surface hyaluronidase-like protein n=1 Tax=Lates japonicus TaxID=270547 RepID=A0AAD3N6W1_LATJO|nr:cell surface hyaluronidase-like protein [Lates japonicus]